MTWYYIRGYLRERDDSLLCTAETEDKAIEKLEEQLIGDLADDEDTDVLSMRAELEDNGDSMCIDLVVSSETEITIDERN